MIVNRSRLSLSRQEGMSLVEVIVAVAILGIGITALVNALSTGSIAVNIQSERAIALRLAQTQMESVKDAAYDVTGATYATVSAPAGYAVVLNVDSGVYVNSNIQKVTVTVQRSSIPVLAIEGYKVNR